MANRLKIDDILRELLGSDNVYFQPPENFSMEYPCIVYELSRLEPDFADNKPYKIDTVYYVTCIYQDPDSELPLKLASLPMSVHQRKYRSDNLYHDQFRIVC